MKKKTDLFSKVMADLKNILYKKPPFEKMKEEVRLMGFHIRPVDGNVSFINKIKNNNLVEVLWVLGKIDILMEKNFHRLTDPQKEIILRSIEEIQKSLTLMVNVPLQEVGRLGKNNIKRLPSYMMLEVFRKNKIKKNIN